MRLAPPFSTALFVLALPASAVASGAMVSSAGAETPTIDPFALYGEAIEFDVVRKGRTIGFHRVAFSGTPEELTVETEFSIEITLLSLPVFQYDYRAQADWREGVLHELQAEIDDNGEAAAVSAVRDGAVTLVTAPEGTAEAHSPLFPTNHWNPGVVDETQVLNTLTGGLDEVRITAVGQETVETERGAISATRFAYSGDLETEAWYDDAGRWVKLRFEGRDGVPVELLCRRCQGGAGPAGGNA